jgi:hypothetical protein
VRHTKPRFRIRMRTAAIQRRKKGVEFMAGVASNSFFYYRKRNLIDPKSGSTEEDIAGKA